MKKNIIYSFIIKPPIKELKTMTTQLTTSKQFKKENVIFSKAQENKVPNPDPTAKAMKYYRIMISTKYPDGTIGSLITPTNGQLFSFGVSENKSMETNKLTGYSLSLCLHNRDGATDEELEFVKMVTEILEVSKAHMLKTETKKQIKQFDLEARDMRKMDPIYRKKDDDGKVIAGNSPVLYPKLITGKDKKTKEIYCRTTFYEEGKYEEDGEPSELQLKDVIGSYCYATAAIRWESIYIGSGKIRLQFKVVEADIRKLGNGKTNLLRKKRVGGGVSKKALAAKKAESVKNDSNKTELLAEAEDETELVLTD